MSVPSPISAVIFDSGDTLVRPIGGEWLPGQVFRRIVAAHASSDLQWDQLKDALEAGLAHLNAPYSISTEQEEFDQFCHFFTHLLEAIGFSDHRAVVAREIAYETVYGTGCEEPFEDSMQALSRLSDYGLRLCLISNAWPSLERRYRALGLREYFDLFLISSCVGCRKPDPEIFQLALRQLMVPADEVLVIDDAVRNIAAARALGMFGVVLARGGELPTDDHPWVSTLTQLVTMLGTVFAKRPAEEASDSVGG